MLAELLSLDMSHIFDTADGKYEYVGRVWTTADTYTYTQRGYSQDYPRLWISESYSNDFLSWDYPTAEYDEYMYNMENEEFVLD